VGSTPGSGDCSLQVVVTMATPCLERVFLKPVLSVRHHCTPVRKLLLSHQHAHLSGDADATIWEPF